MSIIAQDLKDLSCHVARENTLEAWHAYVKLLEALAVDTEVTTIGEDADGLKKAYYYYFSDGTMICVRGVPKLSSSAEIKAYDSIGD